MDYRPGCERGEENTSSSLDHMIDESRQGSTAARYIHVEETVDIAHRCKMGLRVVELMRAFNSLSNGTNHSSHRQSE